MRWVQSLPKYEDPEDKDGPIKWFGPVLASDRLMVVGNHGEVLSVSPYTGAFLSKLELTDKLSVAPVVASGSFFLIRRCRLDRLSLAADNQACTKSVV